MQNFCRAMLMAASIASLHFRSRWVRWCTTWHSRSWDTIGASIIILVSCDTNSIVNSTIAFIMSRWSNETWHGFFSHMIPLVPASASHDANNIVNGTIAFVRLTWLKQGVTWLSWSCDTISASVGVMWHCWYQLFHYKVLSSVASLHSLGWDNQNKVQCGKQRWFNQKF